MAKQVKPKTQKAPQRQYNIVIAPDDIIGTTTFTVPKDFIGSITFIHPPKKGYLNQV